MDLVCRIANRSVVKVTNHNQEAIIRRINGIACCDRKLPNFGHDGRTCLNRDMPERINEECDWKKWRTISNLDDGEQLESTITKAMIKGYNNLFQVLF